MSEIAVFDTNVLPQARGLQGPLWLSIAKLCTTVGVEMALPRIVVHESVNLRREGYASASADLLEAVRQVSRFSELDAVYVPAVDEVTNIWEQELMSTFLVLDTHGEDAAESLKREALRVRPARRGKGARDSAIWMTALRLTDSYDKVSFVSRNTKDFCAGSEDLHPDLAKEAATRGNKLVYFASVDSFIAALATAIAAPVYLHDALVDVLRFELRDAVHKLVMAQPERAIEGDQLGTDGIEVSEISVKRSYSISGDGLALIRGRARLPLGNPADGSSLGATFGAWVDYDITSELPTGGEVHNVVLD